MYKILQHRKAAMNEESYLILIKNKDRTSEVASYKQGDPYIQVSFRGSSKPYTYFSSDVIILNNPVTTVITEGQAVINKDSSLNNVIRLLDFGPKTRVFFSNGTNRLYETEHIRIESSGVKNADAQKVMDYWRAISVLLKNGEEQPDREDFMKREFAKLSYVHPDSVLSHYVNGEPVRADIPVASEPIFPFKYNLSQKLALDQALRSKISIIEGPPGTGKTQTILNILANLAIMQQKKVAVVSGNNAAVQNVRDKLENEGYHFFVAALGNKENKENFFANLPEGDISNWKCEMPESELIAKVQEMDSRIHRLMELDREMAQLKQQLSAYVLEQKHFEDYYAKQNVEQLGRLSLYRQTPDRILEFMKDSQIAWDKEKDKSFFYKFKLFFKHGFIDFKRLMDQEADVILDFQQKFYLLKIEELSSRIATLEQELQSQSYRDLLEEHQQCSALLFRHRLHERYHDRSPLDCNAKSYKNNENFQSFIEYYPIVLSTTHSLRNCVPSNYLFDYVIIDESSQVDLVTGALALSCCKQAIIVGDTKQLPQIVDDKMEQIVGSAASVGINAAYSYFQHNLLSSMLALYGDDILKVMLKEHYRCHPRIIQFCNQKYYNGELITFTSEKDKDDPLLIYRTVPGNHMREVTHSSKGKFNQRELDVIEREALVGLEEVASSHTDIGFVTPYRKQVEKASGQLAKDIESDTIHKYQGREKPIMMMSTVLDQTRSGKIGIKFVNDPCKINVAVSRAQKKFILVTDHTLFRKYGNEIGDLIRYMEYSTLDDNVLESEIISVFDLLYQEYSDKLHVFRERVRGVNVSKFKTENIMQALLEDMLKEPAYNGFTLGNQVRLLNLFRNVERLDERERRFIRRASVDFVIYHKLDKTPALAIEADGFAFHENNPEQLKRDEMKEDIFKKYGFELQRYATTGSSEEQKIRERLNTILQS